MIIDFISKKRFTFFFIFEQVNNLWVTSVPLDLRPIKNSNTGLFAILGHGYTGILLRTWLFVFQIEFVKKGIWGAL